MRVTDLRIDRFGEWTGVDLRDLALGLNVMFFPDAATKTALVQFVPSVLYGFSDGVRQQFLNPALDQFNAAAHEFAAGGAVAVESPLGRYRVTRHDHGPQGGHLAVHTSDGHLCPAETLANLLSRVDRGTYRDTFVFPVRDFEGLGQLSSAELQARFARYGALAEPAAIAHARAGLAKLRADAWRALPQGVEAHRATCRRLRQEIQTLLADQRRQESELLRRQPEFETSLVRLNTTATQLREEIEAIAAKISALEGKPLPVVEQRVVETPVDDWQRKLARLEARLQKLSQLLRRVDVKRSKLRVRITKCTVDDALWRDSQHAIWFARRSENFRSLEQRAQELHRCALDIARQTEAQGRVRTQELLALEPLTASLCGDIEAMSNELRAFESRAYQRDLLLAGERRLRQLQSKLASKIRRLTDRKQRLLCRCEAGGGLTKKATKQTVVIETNREQHAAALAQREAELNRLRAELESLRVRLRDIEGQIPTVKSQLAALASQLETLRADRSLAEKRCDLAAAEAALEQATEQWRAAAAASSVLEATASGYNQSQRGQVGLTELLSAASGYLRQLSAGRMTQVRARVGEGGLEVQLADLRAVSLASLDALGRKTLLFCLRLAAAQGLAQQGVQLPILVDDVLGQFDSSTCIAAARLLVNLSQSGYQVLYFTCRQEIAVLFEELQVPSRRVSWRGERLAVSQPIDTRADLWTETASGPPQASSVVQQRVEPQYGQAPRPSTIPVVAALTVPAPPAEEVAGPRGDQRFLLGLSCPAADIPSMDGESARRLRDLGIRTAGDLMAADADKLAERLSHPALRAPRLMEWQAEAMLASRVPLLSRHDLKLLLAIGICQPEELAAISAEQLLHLLDSRASEHSILSKSRDYVASKANGWIRDAGQARSLPHTLIWKTAPAMAAPHFTATRARVEEPVARAAATMATMTAATPLSLAAGTTGVDRSSATAQTKPAASEPQAPRFYLSKSSPIGESPSVGPKTAKRLMVLGIYSVADLLDADAEETASRLGLKWITATTIRDWQAQATLVCRVPMLRGHDAQLLVAAGYREPEQFMHLSPRQLLNLLQPLVDSSQGERILRGANAPDLDEVTDWIRWAGQARALRVA